MSGSKNWENTGSTHRGLGHENEVISSESKFALPLCKQQQASVTGSELVNTCRFCIKLKKSL